MKNFNNVKKINKLNYDSPSNYNLVTNRRFVRHRATSDRYNATSVMDLFVRSGFDYVYNKNSFLKVTVNVSDVNNFGSGDALNLIDEVIITDNNGVLLEHTKNIDIEHRLGKFYKNSSDNLKYLFNDLGFYPNPLLTDDPLDVFDNNRSLNSMYGNSQIMTYLLPLKALSPFFNPYMDTLYPDLVYNDLHIQVKFNESKKIFITDNPETYNITNCELYLDSFTLSKKLYDALLNESVKHSIMLSYINYDVQRYTLESNNNQLIYVKSLNHACSCVGVVYENNISDSTVIDSLHPSNITSSYQFRLNSNMYPSYPGDNIHLNYKYALDYYKPHKGAVTFNLFEPRNAAIPTSPFSRGEGVMIGDFSRSASKKDKSSTQPINKDQPLEIYLEVSPPTGSVASDFHFYLFVYHMKLIKLYSNEKAIVFY